MFKNCTALRIVNPDTLAMFRSDEFEEIARENLTLPPHKTQWRRYGFHIPPQFNENPIYTGALNVKLFVICKQERVLPGAVINKRLGDKIADFETKNNRPPFRKEIAEFKDDIIAKSLPKAFVKPSYTMVMVTKNWLMVDSGSSKVVEDIISYLRDILSEAPQLEYRSEWQHIQVTTLPNLEAPYWLRKVAVTPWTSYSEGDDVPEDAPTFRHLDSVVLKSRSKGGVVRLKDIDFSEREADAALESGKSVVELALEWGEDPAKTALSCVITDKLVIRRLKFAEINLQEVPEEELANKAAIHFDATLAITAEIMVKFINAVYQQNAVGGDEGEPIGKLAKEVSEFTQRLADAGLTISSDTLDGDGTDDDEALYMDAVIYVQSTGKASISAVQRELRIGYNRAARLIERMEENNIVSGPDATGVRTVYEDDEI